jgi:hypothetical protein
MAESVISFVKMISTDKLCHELLSSFQYSLPHKAFRTLDLNGGVETLNKYQERL